MIAQVERPGTQLHTGWAHVDSPDIAKAYWKLPADAKFVDTLKCMVSTLSICSTIICTIYYTVQYYCIVCIIYYDTILLTLSHQYAQFADECHHRDVNHTFAELKTADPNPFVLMHKQNALRAHVLEMSGETAWPSKTETAKSGRKD